MIANYGTELGKEYGASWIESAEGQMALISAREVNLARLKAWLAAQKAVDKKDVDSLRAALTLIEKLTF